MPDCQSAPALAWQKTIPQLSFDSEVVLNPMLALSALHLHTHSPADFSMTVALRRYLDRTLVNHRRALSKGEGLSEQLWLSAILLCHVYWLLSRQSQPYEAYELPFQAFKMLEGINVIFAQKEKFLGRLGYNSFKYESLPQVVSEDKLSISSRVQLQSIEEDITHLMDSFDVATKAEDVQNIYIEARDSVLYHYRAFYSGISAKILRRLITVMPVRCQLGYRSLLESHDPLAMALLARVLVLLRGLGYAWWINGGGEYEVVERDFDAPAPKAKLDGSIDEDVEEETEWEMGEETNELTSKLLYDYPKVLFLIQIQPQYLQIPDYMP
ncbi:hypothetical protein SBOR_8050 [Sclerotinia borealis F-4128]|uniref:Uncharacterized protein n=1 Tax=Sclerotinia borealis (strain F-4128) TaxID=1432307 RepID=W9C9K7_SCLBF|nr:hypothetical protein SBOR_8050 [Sclerotinia borealis F-4128]